MFNIAVINVSFPAEFTDWPELENGKNSDYIPTIRTNASPPLAVDRSPEAQEWIKNLIAYP